MKAGEDDELAKWLNGGVSTTATLGHASITVTAHTYAHLYDTLANALDSLTMPKPTRVHPHMNETMAH